MRLLSWVSVGVLLSSMTCLILSKRPAGLFVYSSPCVGGMANLPLLGLKTRVFKRFLTRNFPRLWIAAFGSLSAALLQPGAPDLVSLHLDIDMLLQGGR